MPDRDAGGSDQRQDRQEGFLVLNALDRDPIDDGKDHNGRNIVARQIEKRIRWDQELEKAEAFLWDRGVDDARRRYRRNGERQHEHDQEASAPHGEINHPAAAKQSPGRVRGQASQSVQQGTDDVGKDDHLHQHHVGRADGSENRCFVTDKKTDQDSEYGADQNPKGETGGVGGFAGPHSVLNLGTRKHRRARHAVELPRTWASVMSMS